MGAFNNLGVAASKLGLGSISVEYYELSEGLGNTLATANLAWDLINAGFLKEARARLEAQVLKPEVHPNVLEALGGVAKRRENDDNQRDAILKNARRVSLFRCELGSALVKGARLGPDVNGTYGNQNAQLQVTVSQEGSVTGEIRAPFIHWSLTGQVLGVGIYFSWRSVEKKEDYLASLYAKKGHGVLVLTDGQFSGFTYEGDIEADPSALSSFKEWRFSQ